MHSNGNFSQSLIGSLPSIKSTLTKSISKLTFYFTSLINQTVLTYHYLKPGLISLNKTETFLFIEINLTK